MRQNGKVSFQETSLFTIGIIRWLLLILVIILFRFELPYPAILLVLVLVITELGKWWSRYGINKIQVEVNFNPPRLFAGEDAVFSVQLFNRKLLPVLLDFKQPVAEDEILFSEADEIELSTILSGWGRVSQKFTLTARSRGYYELPEAVLICGDGMGLYSTQMLLNKHQPLIVYPRIVTLPELGLQATDLIGEKADHRYILPDPVQVAGLRPYTPDLPARLINWKASAHQDTLMARIIEPSADYKLCLLLDVENYQDETKELYELAVSTLASIVIWADERGIPYGVFVNGVQKGLNGPISIPVASGFDHTRLVMEKLARLTEESTGTLEQLISHESDQIPWGSSLVIIGGYNQLTLPTGNSKLYQVTVLGPIANKGNVQ